MGQLFWQFVNEFLASFNAKYIIEILNMADFLRFLLYRKVLKFWLYQTVGWECIRKASSMESRQPKIMKRNSLSTVFLETFSQKK